MTHKVESLKLLSQLCVSLLQTKFKYSVLRVSLADPEEVKLKLNLSQTGALPSTCELFH